MTDIDLRKTSLDRVAASRHGTSLSQPHHSFQAAIVGLACRFPGSENADEYYESLMRKEVHVSDQIRARWERTGCQGIAAAHCATLEEPFGFDHRLFRISAREAEAMDPHHRLLIETTWQCMEDAGYTPQEFSKRSSGVFVAMYNQDFAYYKRGAQWEPESRLYLGIGSAHCMLPNRISHLFDLRGPSEIVDTACSSSLVAIHRAVRSIGNGECVQAIVGAVSLLLDPERLIELRRLGVISSNGRCAIFDGGIPTGQVMGEGVAALVLKRCAEAQADGDHIYGVVRGSGAVHAGRRSASLTSPDAATQISLITEVYRAANVDAGEVDYIEAHGNGGKGDLSELLAFQEVFARQIPVGSVKMSIGCAEAAGGLAQVIKVLMAMKRDVMPATVGHTALPEVIASKDCAPIVLTEERSLRALAGRPDAPFVAAINSYGLGGVYAHLVLEQQRPTCTHTSHAAPVPILVSARRPDDLRTLADRIATRLRRELHINPVNIAYTLAIGRLHHSYRWGFLAATCEDIVTGLERFSRSLGNPPESGMPSSMHRSDEAQLGAAPSSLSTALDQWLAGKTIEWRCLFGSGQRVPLDCVPLMRKTFHLPPFVSARAVMDSRAEAPQRMSMEAFVSNWFSNQCRMETAEIDPLLPLAHFGVDSVTRVAFCEAVDRTLSLQISASEVTEDTTLDQLVKLLQARAASRPDAGTFSIASEPLDVAKIRSLPERARIFEVQYRQLAASLRPASSHAFEMALAPFQQLFQTCEDQQGGIWLFLQMGAGNTFDLLRLQALAQCLRAIRQCADANSTRALYVSHRGKDFSLGGDRRSFIEAVKHGDHEKIAEVGRAFKTLLAELAAMPFMTIGVAYGNAQGGGLELLMALDIQIAWPGVKFALPEARSGLIAGMGGITYLAHLVGANRAMRVNATGEFIDSREAERLGIISFVSDSPYQSAKEFASSLPDRGSALEVRKILNARKYDLMEADVDAWVALTCKAAWLDRADAVRRDFDVIEGTVSDGLCGHSCMRRPADPH